MLPCCITNKFDNEGVVFKGILALRQRVPDGCCLISDKNFVRLTGGIFVKGEKRQVTNAISKATYGLK